MTRIRSARTAGSAVRPDVRIAGMTPGCTELARMLSFACCTAVAFVISRTAAFEALYAMWTCSLPIMPAIDDRLTMEPPPAAFIAGMACLMPKNTPVALIAMMRCQASVLKKSCSALPETPALFTSTSSLPNCRVVSATTAAQLSSSVTSSRANRAAAPIASATCLPSCSITSAMTTLAPSRANIRAVAAPMPDAAPDIMATLPASLMVAPLPLM